MADENNIKKVLQSIVEAADIPIRRAAEFSDTALKAYHPKEEPDSQKYAIDNPTPNKNDSTKGKSNHSKSNRLDVRHMTAEQLADKFEADGKNRKPEPDVEQETTNEESENEKSGSGGKEKSRLEQTKEAFEKAKDKINDFKNNIMDRAESREKWKKVLDKAQHDNNWEKNRIPKWSTKLLMHGSDDLEAKNALKNFEAGDKWIKKTARNRKMKVAAHGSLKAAEDTMEGIKLEREFMADEAKKIRRAKRKLLFEKHPVGKAATKLGLDKFVDMDNGLFTKIFDPENSACMKSCSMKMIVLSLFGSGFLGTLLTLIFTF